MGQLQEQKITNKCHSPISRRKYYRICFCFVCQEIGFLILGCIKGHACSWGRCYWRDVALSTPRFLTSRHLARWAGPKQFDLEMVNTWLVRSAPYISSVDSRTGMNMLMQYSSRRRWEEVVFDLSPSSFHALSAIRNSLPCLKIRTIDILWPLDNFPTFDAFEFAPRLLVAVDRLCVQLHHRTGVFFHQTPHLATSKLIIHGGVVEPSFHWFHVHLDALLNGGYF
jgi:hypothetical protein